MAPKDWEEDVSDVTTPPSSPIQAPVIRRTNFDDEEYDSDVLDSWDAADDSDAEREKAKKAAELKAKADAAAKANHKSKTERIAAHQALNQRRREEADDEDSSDEEDEADRRFRLRREQKQADLSHAEDLFGDLNLGSSNRPASKPIAVQSSDPTNSINFSSLPLFNPNNKDQFSKLREVLVPLLSNNSNKAHYVLFMQEFTKQVCKQLPSDQIKKIASGLTTLSNEKMKEEKAADKGGKKTKAAKTKSSLVASRNLSYKADVALYEDDGLDDDDFM